MFIVSSMSEQLIEKFWSRVDRSGDCWEWTGSKKSSGYGQLWIGKTIKYAHRISWELTSGPIPTGLWVLHKCDNPACVKPGHLFLGTHQDNVTDMMNKGRHVTPFRKGCSYGAKLSRADVEIIRKTYVKRQGRVLCEKYGISRQALSDIILFKKWKNI